MIKNILGGVAIAVSKENYMTDGISSVLTASIFIEKRQKTLLRIKS